MMRRKPGATFVAPPLCVTCQAKMVPIVYGYPGDGLMEAAERGEVVLGGCVIWPNQPRWKCPTCKERRSGGDHVKQSTRAPASAVTDTVT